MYSTRRCPDSAARRIVFVAPILALLAGCQQPRDAKPFWVCTRPAPALRELEDLDPARSAGITQPRPEKRVAPPVAAPEPVRPPQPVVRTVLLGRSTNGTPIEMHLIGTQPRPTLIFGAIHGNEPTSAALAKKFLAWCIENPGELRGCSVAIIPVANPDGLEARTRGNANGVDCNRNFPARNWARSQPTHRFFGGVAPGSEPETRAIVNAVTSLSPRQIISIHSISNGRFCNNFDGPGKSLAEAMAACNQYPVKASIGYPTPGSFGTWAGIERSIPTVTLELPDEKPRESDWWPKNRRALLAGVHHDPNGSPILTTGR